MEGLYTSLSGGMFMEQRLQVLSNDIANLNTPGHKRSRVMLESHFPTVQADVIRRSDPLGLHLDPPEIEQQSYQTLNRLGGMETDFSQGEIRNTGQPLDLAIEGDGFFVIETSTGEQYTRNGAFGLNAQGEICMFGEEGFLPLLGEGGPLTLTSTDIEITENGVVTDRDGLEVGRLRLVRFDNAQELRRVGNSLYANDNDVAVISDVAPEERSIRQYTLEMSNANPMLALVELIELQRSHQAVSKIMTTIDQVVGQRVNAAMDR